MDVEGAFVSDGKPAKLVDPRQAAFDDPSVTAEFLASLDASRHDRWLDPLTAARTTAAAVVVSLFGAQLVWSAPLSATLTGHHQHGVEQVLEGRAIVGVGPIRMKDRRSTIETIQILGLGSASGSRISRSHS
jgi:hypothetical protein